MREFATINQVIGPEALPRVVNGRTFCRFFRTNWNRWMEELELDEDDEREIYVMFDGAPIHRYLPFRAFLNARFRNRWIGRDSQIRWPARSPDLNILDFFYWGVLKTYVYEKHLEPPQNLQELDEGIEEANQSITPEMIQEATQNIIKRARLCVEVNGGHFEHLLKTAHDP